MSENPFSSWFPEDIPLGAVALEEGKASPPIICDCCGRQTIRVSGFLSREDYACAVYFASWTEGHVAEDGLRIILSVGGWGGSDHPRVRIAILCWIEDESISMMALDPFDENGNPLRWNDDEPFFGPFVRRERALGHPDMPEIFHLAEHVVEDDQRVRAALYGYQKH
ncbi:hypothetical protein [Microvirga solisilvae]|uniref:hypothetical protein n=1 Tax=Microvirga solisilvae TaxID=2919498 RepID=UPI001FAE92C0|nr:hypothetical protein [Microvirga solisilvae]